MGAYFASAQVLKQLWCRIPEIIVYQSAPEYKLLVLLTTGNIHQSSRHVEVVGSTCIDSERGAGHLGREVGASASRIPKRLAVMDKREVMKVVTLELREKSFTT